MWKTNLHSLYLIATASLWILIGASASPRAPERTSLAPPKNDPFSGFAFAPKVVSSKQSKSVPVRIPEAAPLAVLAPQAPPLDLQYVGRLNMGDAAPQIYVIHQSQWLTLEKGTTLQNGYVVESVEHQRVQLWYPPLNVSRQFFLPPLPAVEKR